MTLVGPVEVTVAALKAKGHDVHPLNSAEAENIDKRAISSAGYVWVEEEVTGRTAHIRYSDQPAITIVVYSNKGRLAAAALARQVQRDLLDSVGVAFPEGGIHRVITVVRPYRQDLPGIPPGTGRAVAQYTLVTSDTTHWE